MIHLYTVDVGVHFTTDFKLNAQTNGCRTDAKPVTMAVLHIYAYSLLAVIEISSNLQVKFKSLQKRNFAMSTHRGISLIACQLAYYQGDLNTCLHRRQQQAS